MRKRSITDIDVAGRRVLVRVDFNVPLDEDGRITDERRIVLALPTIRSVLQRGGRVILISHLGRPEGEGFEAAYTLQPVAERLGELLSGTDVQFIAGDCVSEEAIAAAQQLRDGQVLLMENLRFHPGEKAGDEEFARTLAGLADVYCNDAFGAAHRNDASMLAVPQAMDGRPCVAGLLLAGELNYLSGALEEARQRGTGFIAVLGGAKVSDKLGAIRNLAGSVNDIVIGGAMACTFLKARGDEVGSSRVEQNMLDEARAMLKEIEAGSTRVHLPADHVCAQAIERDVPTRVFDGAIEAGWMALDIGPQTQQHYAGVIAGGQTIVWNGPMGVFEVPPFDQGTRIVAEAMVGATEAGAVSIVGGGDSAAAVEQFGLAERFSHISTGGGASIQMLEGRRFDSVTVLNDA